MTRLRVALDGTPLLGARTGVGRYVEELLRAMAGRPGLALTASPFTVRTGTRPDLPSTVRWHHVPVPARALRASWLRLGGPPAELLAGRCDVFHGTNFVLPPLARARGVVTVHDVAYLRFPETVEAASRAYRDLVPRGLRRASAVLTPSAAVAGEVRAEYGLPEDRVVVTPLGVDAAWYDSVPPEDGTRRALGLPDRYLVFVGTREPRKQLPLLVRAHRAARAEDSEAVPALVLCGPAGWGGDDGASDGPLRLGYLPLPTLRSVVAGAEALVLPSLYEGFGLPVLEALACATGVVCSDLPVLREVAGDVAAYAAVGDVDALADALVTACRDGAPGTADERRSRARAFTWSACADRTVEAYQR